VRKACRRALLTVIAAVQLILAVGFGVFTSGVAYSEEPELVVWHSYRGLEEEAVLESASVWGQQQGVDVRLVPIPFGAFDSKIETSIPRGNGPDIFIGGHSNVAKWVDFSLLQPAINEVGAQRASADEALVVEGVPYGYPLALKTLVLLYNPELIDSPPSTTDELISMASAQTGEGSFGLVYEATAAYYHAPWMHAFGADISSGSATDLDTPEHAAALGFTRRLAADEEIVPLSPSSELMSSLYNAGKAAFIISGPWFVGDVELPIAAVPLPVVSETGEPAKPFLTVEGAFVVADSEQSALAHQFAAWLSGSEGSEIRQRIGLQAVSLASAPPSEDPVVSAVEEQAESAVLMPTDPTIPSVWEALERALRRTVRGAATPTEAAHEASVYLDVFSRPPPTPASPTPYLILMAVVLLGGFWWCFITFRNPHLRSSVHRHRRDYLWVLPATLSLTVLVMLPFVVGACISAFAHQGGEWTFVGLKHFFDILLSRDWPLTSPMSFYYTMIVTVLWTVTNVILHVSIGVAMALLLREPWVRMRGLWRALLIIPWAIPNYITALIWKTMFHVQFGAINSIIGAFVPGDDPVQVEWFGSFATAFSANLITNTWLGFPFMMVVTLGALQSIPRELEEAASIDGASWSERFRFVVWPMLKPALMPALIIGSVWTFNMFNVVYLVSAGEPDGSTEILISEAYRWAFSRGNRYGYAAAYSILIFGLLWFYSRGANKVAGKKVL